MTGGIGAVGTVAYSSSQKKRAVDLMKQREEIVDDLDNDNLPEDIKDDLSDKLSKIDESINKIDDDNEIVISKLSDEDKTVLKQKESKIQSIEQALQDESLSETAKETLADRLLKEQDSVDEILTKTKQEDAIQVEAAGQVPVLTEATVSEEVEQGKPEAKPKVVAEEGGKAEEVGKEEKTKVYHGADIDFTVEGKRNRIMFTSKNKDYAQYYAKQRSGKLFEFDVEKSKIAKEEYVKNKIKSLGLKTKEGDLVDIDDNLHRLIDPRFEDTAISKKGLDELFTELEKEGYYGVDFMDENQELGGMNEIESTAIFNPKELVKTTEKSIKEQTPAQKVEQLRAEEQVELNAAIPNADQYLTDGKVDRAKITDAKDLKKFDEIYDKYDKLITPLLPKKEAKAEIDIKQQIENFGVAKDQVEPVNNVILQVFDGLKKAGLTTAKNVGEWVGIGKGSKLKNALFQPDNLIEVEKSEIIQKAKANGTYLKAPNGKKSNLNESQWVTVRTNNFKKWFGDWENDPKNASKVVDKNGEPLVVYHGSKTSDIKEFNRRESERISSGLKENGIYFTSNKKLADFYQ
jgi:hypothetical protein